jgi:signal transduction histidine kinase
VRRRLLSSTLAIALLAILTLGVPLAILARHEVLASARDRLQTKAATVAASVEDSVDRGQVLTSQRLGKIASSDRVIVTTANGKRVVAGAPIPGDLVGVTISGAGATVTVQEPRSVSADQARNVTLLVGGLSVLSTAAAVALAFRQARTITAPLAGLAERAHRLGRGDFVSAPVMSGVAEIDEISLSLERSAAQIGALIELQRQFAADAAHQLRTPLTGIGLRLDEISFQAGEAVREEVDQAQRQLKRLNDVITTLLARARDDSAAPTDLDLTALVRQEAQAWERVLTRQGRGLRLELGAGAVAHGRREHIVAITSSLLENALHHGIGDINVAVGSDSEGVWLSVRDSGTGIPLELGNTVFVRSVTGSHSAGSGIGLALAHALAEADGGTLYIADPDRARLVARFPSSAPSSTRSPSR